MTPTQRPTLRSLLGLAALVAVAWGGSEGLGRWQDARAAEAIRDRSQRVGITLYTTSSCPYCARAAAWLNRHGVRWQECNVETDAACLRAYTEQGSPGVPLVRAGERWHLGFHAPWLAEALAAQDAPRNNAKSGARGDARGAPSPGTNAIQPIRNTASDQPANPSGASSPRP